MKVLLVHDDGARTGGSSYQVELLAQELRAQGHAVLVVTATHPNNSFSDQTFPRHNATSLRRVWRLLWNPDAYVAVRRAVRSFHPDVVHTHFIMGQCSPSVWFAAGTVPVVITLHDTFLAAPRARLDWSCSEDSSCTHRRLFRVHGWKYPYELLRNAWYRFALRTVRLAISPSVFVAEQFSRNQRVPVRVIPNGVRAWHVVRKPVAGRVLFVGRISEEKGIAELLTAFARVTSSVPNAVLHVAGEGPLREELQARFSSLVKNRRLLFLGALSPDNIQQEYARASLLVVPSICPENQPTVILEALRIGVPVIASRKGGIPELLDDALLFPSGDASVLATALRAWLTHPKRCSAALRKSRKNVRAHEPATFAQHVLSAYREVLA